MEHQSVTTHKDSWIINDANDYAVDTVGEMLLTHSKMKTYLKELGV